MTALQRITTQFNETEDRIKISGEIDRDIGVNIWLSQRLLKKVVTHLLLWLEKQSNSTIPSSIVQSFAQDAASSEMVEETPVELDHSTQEWLVVAVDITPNPNAIFINFRGADEQQTSLVLDEKQLRQWIQILYNLWMAAEWTTSVWPDWITVNTGSPKSGSGTDLH